MTAPTTLPTPIDERQAIALERIAEALDNIAALLAAPAALKTTGLQPNADDGWVPWTGGQCPVPDGTLVDVRYRNGDQSHGLSAHTEDYLSGGNWIENIRASGAYWRNDGYPNDIIAYRIHKETAE